MAAKFTAISFDADWRNGTTIQREVETPDEGKARQIAQAQLIGGAIYAQLRSPAGNLERVRLEEGQAE